MRNFLHSLYVSLSKLWQRDLFQHRVRIGLSLGIPFLLLVVVSLFFGSGDAIRAVAHSSSLASLSQNAKNLPLDYQFMGQGQITGGTENTWIIGNVPVRMDGHTQQIGDLHVGDFVILSGRVLQNHTWLADRIQPTLDNQSLFTYNGPLEQIAGNIWHIGGHPLTINQQTERGENLQVNQIVLATFTALEDGNWVALKILAFDKFPTQALTPVPTSTPVIEKKEVIPSIGGNPPSRGGSVNGGNKLGQQEEKNKGNGKNKKDHPGKGGKGRGK